MDANIPSSMNLRVYLYGEKMKIDACKEQIYILKRKIIALINSMVFILCRIWPINNKLVSVCTFEGKGGFGCNPKYIVQELHKIDESLEFIWFVNKEIFPEKQFPKYIKKVPNTLFHRAYWLTKSKVWIDNYRKPYGTIKRKKQYYLNTWHASEGFKAIGLLRGTGFSRMAYLVSKNDSDMIDMITIDSRYLASMYRKGLIYQGEYLKVGQCRCDILFGNREVWKDKFKKDNNLSNDTKLVLYAPTFREHCKSGCRTVSSEASISLDFERLVNNLSRRFGGNWCVCLRCHPQLSGIVFDQEVQHNVKIIDVSKVDDMYEIMAAMDVCITDYSSVAFDAGLCRMPVFLYADDISDFCCKRGGMLWLLSEDTEKEVHINDELTPGFKAVLPYPVAKDNDELEERILTFDEDSYQKKVTEMENSLGIMFDGQASVNTAQHIIKYMKGNV